MAQTSEASTNAAIARPGLKPSEMAVPPMAQKLAHTPPDTLHLVTLVAIADGKCRESVIPVGRIARARKCSVSGKNGQNIRACPLVDLSAILFVFDRDNVDDFANGTGQWHLGGTHNEQQTKCLEWE